MKKTITKIISTLLVLTLMLIAFASCGADGAQGPQGEAGKNGVDGKNGKSAYDLAVENGYVGTVEQWLASLVGAQGEKGDKGDAGAAGAQGEKGDKGDKGDAGVNGWNGRDGKDGKDGVGISSVDAEYITEDGKQYIVFTVTYTDSTSEEIKVALPDVWDGSTVDSSSLTVNEDGDYVITKAAEFAAALELATDGGTNPGNMTVVLEADLNMNGKPWTPIKVDGYHGTDIITVEGNGHTITGLTSPLFKGGFAGESGIIIKDLTIADSHIVSTSTQGSGAFIECVDSMETIILENCHLINSSVSGSRTGGLIGWTSGYSNQNDGPVKTYVTIKDCSVVGCELTATGSLGGIIGHAGASDWTYHTIDNCTVSDTKLTSTDDGDWRVGTIVGTANCGEVTITDCTSSGNTVAQAGKTAPAHELYGRVVFNGTGKLVIDGTSITE